MTLFSPNPIQAQTSCPMGVPGWVLRRFGFDGAEALPAGGLVESSDGAWALARAVIAQANGMDDDTLQLETTRTYQSLLQQLGSSAAPNPVRAWNAIPSITRTQTGSRDRYMAFNAGRIRFAAAKFAFSLALAYVLSLTPDFFQFAADFSC